MQGLVQRDDHFILMGKTKFSADKFVHQIRIRLLRIEKLNAICDLCFLLFKLRQFLLAILQLVPIFNAGKNAIGTEQGITAKKSHDDEGESRRCSCPQKIPKLLGLLHIPP